jgi:hypothetical protein
MIRRAVLVSLPTGTGKTRRVWSHILHRCGTHHGKLNARLQRTMIMGPKEGIRHVWLRELILLLAKRNPDFRISSSIQKLSRHKRFEEIDAYVRKCRVGQLSRILSDNNYAIPRFCSFRTVVTRVKSIHYLILDEWHRAPWKMRNNCLAVENGSHPPWYHHSGHRKIKTVYFVSATPVNPVLNEEVESKGREEFDCPVEDNDFLQKVGEAKSRAYTLIEGLTGVIISRKPHEPFFNAIKLAGVEKLQMPKQSASAKWQPPRPAQYTAPMRQILPPNAIAQYKESLKKAQNGEAWKAAEHVYVVGLVRTTRHKGFHRIVHSKKSKKYSFGHKYIHVHVPPGRRKINAAHWLVEEHPRFSYLKQILSENGIIYPNTNALTGIKALIFCTHAGVAMGVTYALRHFLGHDFDHQLVQNNISARTKKATVDLQRKFNSPDPPFILVATDAFSESIDLHQHCKLVVNYELPWSPLVLAQRVGRLTRYLYGRERPVLNRNVRAAHVVIPGSVDEERVNRLTRRREFIVSERLLPSGFTIEQYLKGFIGSGPSLHYAEILGL